MNDNNELELNKKAFEEKFQSSFDQIRKQKGACPPIDLLIRFQIEGQFEEGSIKIKEHLEGCGHCDFLFEQMKRFDQAIEKGGLSLSPAQWARADARMTKRFENFLKDRKKSAGYETEGKWTKDGRGHRIQNAIVSFFLKPIVAYVMILALVYPAYRGVVQKPEVVRQVVKEKEIVEVPKPVLGMGTAKSYNLTHVRKPGAGESHDDPRGAKIKLGDQENFFILSFFVAINPSHRYDAEIVDGNGRLIWQEKAISSDDGYGNFSLVCHKQLFSAGSYELKVEEVDPQTNRIYKQSFFRFDR